MAAAPMGVSLRFAIDRGGTFTDIVAMARPAGGGRPTVVTEKLLSRDPGYPDAPSEGIRRILCRVGIDAPAGSPIPTAAIDEVRMGTTVATNALLERNGARTLLLVTAGFEDALEIGTQARPRLFDLDIRKPAPLYERVAGVAGRVAPRMEGATPTGAMAELVRLDEDAANAALRSAFADGIRSVAVAFVHSHAFDVHERRVGELAQAAGFDHVTLSSALIALPNYVPRAQTAVVNAYLAPVVAAYVASFESRFVGGAVPALSFMQSDGTLCPVSQFDAFRAVLSGPAGGVIGCAEAAAAAFDPPGLPEGDATPAVGFDMGGTSTDVSRVTGRGRFETAPDSVVAGATLQAPQVDVNTVAAGGGSVLTFRHGVFQVGPESAGAFPGPACYGRGGPLTVTDANAVLGYVQPAYFPAVFGADGRSRIDVDAARRRFTELAADAAEWITDSERRTPEALALAFVQVADEAMSRPIRALTEGRGRRTADHALVCFGGAGGQHAARVARALQVSRVVVPRFSGLLSAVGIAAAETSAEVVHSCEAIAVDGAAVERVKEGGADASETAAAQAALDAALEAAEAAVVKQIGVGESQMRRRRRAVTLRFAGTGTGLTLDEGDVVKDPRPLVQALVAAFVAAHTAEFGFALENRAVWVNDVRVRFVASPAADDVDAVAGLSVQFCRDMDAAVAQSQVPPPDAIVKSTFDGATGAVATPLFVVPPTTGAPQSRPFALRGPAIILQRGATVVVDPASTATVLPDGDVHLIAAPRASRLTVALDPLALSLFSHRFMSIAEQMGRALGRTAVSVNIKERLDFSCAIFDGAGRLVANAPHIPVHLGAMGATVQWQARHWATSMAAGGAGWAAGDVIVCNHPAFGGSHLPDITVISKVVVLPAAAAADDGSHPADFYVASRGHHTDVGGSTPGSMPPFSDCLSEEGVIIKAHKLIKRGVFDDEAISVVLRGEGADAAPGAIGTRALADNLSDLRAQAAANAKGVSLLRELCSSFGTAVVAAYMVHLQDYSAAAVRALLRRTAEEQAAAATGAAEGSVPRQVVLAESDRMDDGTEICLDATVDAADGSAVFDFSRTGPEVAGAINCPTAVVRSAVLYSLRCLLKEEVPLNDGCLRPIDIRVRRPSLLAPSDTAAVVAGNVLTSQRVTDVVLACFGGAANSQGDMNNLTLGSPAGGSGATFAYYETICGGAGAGPGFAGASAVHTHMTNTRITDVEVLERRCPVLLHFFRVRKGSGGAGRFAGGDGVERCLQVRADATACVLCERRSLAPRGLRGGGDAMRGVNWVIRAAHGKARDSTERAAAQLVHKAVGSVPSGWRAASVGGKATLSLTTGDLLMVQTPGGGAFGA